jgi:aspartate aminotransferase
MGRHLDNVPFSGIIRIRDMMYSVKDPFRLDQGDVSFEAPESVKDAMRRAIDENRSHYLKTTGVPRLLDLLAAKLRRQNGIPIESPDELMVTTGGIHGLYIVCQALLEPGDEVIVPDPEWPPCMGNVRSAQGVPVGCPLHDRLGWRYDLDELAAAITPRTRAVYINSPHNPTGGVLTRADVEAIAALTARHGLWLISDEAYEDVLYDGAEHVSAASLRRSCSTAALARSKDLRRPFRRSAASFRRDATCSTTASGTMLEACSPDRRLPVRSMPSSVSIHPGRLPLAHPLARGQWRST